MSNLYANVVQGILWLVMFGGFFMGGIFGAAMLANRAEARFGERSGR